MHNDKLVCCIYCKCTYNKAQGKSNLAHKTLHQRSKFNTVTYKPSFKITEYVCVCVCTDSMANFQEDKSRRRLDDCEEDKNNKEQQGR